MNTPTSVSKRVIVHNSLGLHARPAALFVQIASRYEDCEVQVAREDETEEVVNGKSIMGLMMLAAAQGTSLEIRVSGPESEEVLNRLVELIDSRFGEE